LEQRQECCSNRLSQPPLLFPSAASVQSHASARTHHCSHPYYTLLDLERHALRQDPAALTAQLRILVDWPCCSHVCCSHPDPGRCLVRLAYISHQVCTSGRPSESYQHFAHNSQVPEVHHAEFVGILSRRSKLDPKFFQSVEGCRRIQDLGDYRACCPTPAACSFQNYLFRQ
jgi:hypothetical protein